jgi:NAD(P)-dependent dehydrogenase (short-subunit alcohol dehydrogenase family)
MLDFTGKTVLITGAAGNLGRAVAAAFAGRGARLVLFDISADGLDKVYPGEDDGRMKCAVDLLKPDAVAAAVAAARKRFGSIDAVAAIAGGFHMGDPVHALPAAAWDRMMDLNARTLINTVGAAVPVMLAQGRGKIVTIGANAARQGMATMGAYIAAKSAVIRLTESLSAEVREKGINVNCVMPSILDTPENRSAMPDADPGNWVAPEKLANVILFLASDEASAVHGASVPVVGLS